MSEGFRPSVDPDDLEPATDTTPLSRSVASRQQRRHRWLTLPSGWLLTLCLFLPAVKLCSNSEPLPMMVFPFLWPPYVVGVIIAIAATKRPDQVAGAGFAVFLLIRITAIGVGGSLLVETIEDGTLEPGALLVILLSAGAFLATWRPATERAVAANSALAAAGSFAFTLAVALDRHSVWGADVAVIAAGVLLAGTLSWCLEALVARSAHRRCTNWR